MSDDDNFEEGNAGGSGCFPWPAGNLKVGGYAMLKNHPCKVPILIIDSKYCHFKSW